MSRTSSPRGGVSARFEDLNLVFSPRVSLHTRLSQIVAVAKALPPEDIRRSNVLQQAHVCQALYPPASKSAADVFSSQHFGEPQELDADLQETISQHVLHLDMCCKSLSAVSGCVQPHTATRADLTCLSSDPGGMGDDAELQISYSCLGSLREALVHVRAKLQGLREPPQVRTASATCSRRPRVLSLVGPPLSGKSTVAKALADSMTSMRPPGTVSSASLLPTVELQLAQTRPVVVVQLAHCHSLEECIHALAARLGVSVCSRDLRTAFRLVAPGSVVVLDNVDLMPCRHVVDCIRLLLNASQVASIVVTSCSPKLRLSHCAGIEEIRPWHVVGSHILLLLFQSSL